MQALSAAYLPHSLGVLAASGALLAAIFVFGYLVPVLGQRAAGICAWLGLPAALFFATWLSWDQPAGYRMLLIVAAVLYAMKAVVHVQGPRLSFGRWTFFCLGWFGMNPALFSTEVRPNRSEGLVLIRAGGLRLATGIGLVVAARTLDEISGAWFLVWPLLLAGLSLTMHFGIFLILTGFWRVVGFPVKPLFRAPLLATSLREFWGRRWNLAFSEMTSIAVYRPLSPFIGRPASVTAAFLFSGLLHEVAISLPAQAGYGWPFFYFGLHAIAMRLEAHFEVSSRLWVVVWMLVPLPLLFHVPFRRGVLEPWLG